MISVKSFVFDFDLKPHQIHLLRDAFIRLSLDESDKLEKNGIDPVIFSNEKIENGELKRIQTYPLIQYSTSNNSAQIIAVGTGVKAMDLLFENKVYLNWKGFQLHNPLLIASQKEQSIKLLANEGTFVYRINNWMPFKDKYTNENNEKKPAFEEWKMLKYEVERLQLLERKLVNHFWTVCKHLNVEVPYTIKVRIISKHGESWPQNNGVAQKTFHLTIESNIFLPFLLGIGGSVSEGFGRLLPAENPVRNVLRNKKEETNGSAKLNLPKKTVKQ